VAQASRDFDVKFKGDATQLTTTLKGVQKSSATMGQNLSKTAKVVGVAFAGMGLAAGKFALESVKAAAEDQKAQLKLAKTLQNVTGATDAAISATEEFITAQQFATGVSDTQLRPALETLVRATGDVTKAQDLLILGLDVSAGSGRDLESISLALAKAQGGQFTALQRLGIVIPENIKKSKDFAKVQEYLNTLFGGQAAVAADTFAGKMAILRERLGEAQETIGATLIPILTKLVDAFLNNVMPAIEAVARTIQFEGAGAGLQLVITNIATVITNLEGTAKKVKDLILLFIGIKTVYPLIAGLAAQWTAVSTAIGVTATTTQIATGVMKKALISTGIGALVVAAGFLVAKIYDIAIAGQSAEADITISSGKIGSRFGTMAEKAHAVVVKMDEISVAARHAMDAVENARLGNNTKTQTSGYVPSPYVPPAVGGGGLTKAQKAAAAAAKAAEKAAAAAAKEMARIVAAASKLATAALTKMNDKLTQAREKLQAAKDAYNGYKDSVKEAIISQFSFTSALSVFTESQKNAKDAAKNLAEAQLKYNEALKDPKNVEKVSEALKDLTAAQKENADATKNQKTFMQSLKEQAATAVGFADKVKTLIKMGLSQSGIDQVIAAGAEAGTAIADELIAGGAGAIKTTNSLLTSVEDAAKSLAKSGADQFYKAGVTQGQAMVDGIISSITKAGFIIQGGMAALPKPLQTALKKGTLTSAQGSELMGIIGNSQSVTAPASKSASGATINLTVNAGMGANGTTIGKDIVDAIKKYERTSGPVFKSA
jgi:hypothetical protein